MLQLTIQASIRVPSPPRRSAEDDQSVGGQRRSSPRRSSPENGSLAALVLILTILALTFDATLARQWGSQRLWPTRRSHHFIGSPTTLEHTWGRNLLLQERNRALTARTSARRRISDLRGGAADAEDDEEEEEEEDEEEEADEDDAGGENETDVEEEEGDQSEYDDESDNEETVAASEEADDEEDVAVTKTKPKRTQAGRAASVSVVYDEPIVASPFLNLYVSIGVMFLAKKVDLFSPTMVRIARYV